MKPKHLSELIERIVREFDGLEVTYWIGGQTGVNEPLNIDEESEKVIKEFLRKALTLVSQETMKAVRVGRMKRDMNDLVIYGHDKARFEQRRREKEWRK